MRHQIMLGLLYEGTTDASFLKSLVRRTFENVARECWGDVEILDPVDLKTKTEQFVEEVLKAAEVGLKEHGITVLCVHTDADSQKDEIAYKHKIEPAKKALQESTEVLCSNIVPIVPVQMQEAWLLADLTELKKQIGTKKSDAELGLNKEPEAFSDPKRAITDAIRIAREGLTKRRREDLKIGELYQPLGQSIPLASLQKLHSYRKFEEHVRDAFRELKLLA